jgi:hypothetical protein
MTTELINATGEELQALAIAKAVPGAVLPYWPIWAAAQFASTDEAKHLFAVRACLA